MRQFVSLLIIIQIISLSATAQCDASFIHSVNQNQVSFTSVNTATGIRHSWNFGDGFTNITQSNPIHTYGQPGQYNVLHIVRDSIHNCIDSALETITLNFTPTCSVNYTYSVATYNTAEYHFYSQVSIAGSNLQSIHWTVNGAPAGASDNLTYIFSQAGTYAVCVSIQSASGCTSQKCDTIHYQPYSTNCGLNGSFTHTADSVQSNHITFTALPNLPSLKYTWNFGDGALGSGRIIGHTYNSAGTYNVKMTVFDTANHCLDSVIQNITVVLPSSQSCTASYTYTINPHGQVSFTAVSNQPIVSETWGISHLNDSVTLHSINPTHTFTDTGYYHVCVTLTTTTGCVQSYCNTIRIDSVGGNIACDASFTYSVNQNQVSFHAASTGQFAHHSWTFGDGSTTNHDANPVHVYAQSGQYQVLHIVRDSVNNCIDSSYQLVTDSFAHSCGVGITYAHPSISNGEYIFFSHVSAIGTSVQSIAWTINGVLASSNESFSHTFTQAGTYHVCVTMTTILGCTSQACDTINYQPYTNNCGISGSFTHTQDSIHRRQVTFTGLPNQPQLQYNWSFGDGTQGSGRITTHSYNANGTYVVKLVISDSITHCLDTVLQSITITEPAQTCTASFTYTVNQHGQASFTASSNQTIVSQVWVITNANDSVTLTTSNPVHTFTDSGYYYVCVVVTTTTGCTQSHCDSVWIHNIGGRTGRLITAYPNPLAGESSVRINVDMPAGARITYAVCDLSGNTVYRSQVAGNTGANIISIPVQQLPRGQYFVDISFGSEKRRSLFQKL